ncbi:MAG TPA: ABC transporter permease [Pyrinomonadaceae bacterium]
MAIPLKYNYLSLLKRRVSTLMTVFSIALVVFIFVSVMALANGLETALIASGDPLNVMVMRRGSGSELSSAVSHEALQVLKYLPGVQNAAGGEPIVSPEVFVIVNLPRPDGALANIAVRGTSPVGADLRPQLRLIEGRMFQPGLREVVVSRTISRRFPGVRLGSQVKLGKANWNIVGIFDAQGTAFDSEIWGDVNQVAGDFSYQDYSSVLLRAKDAAAVKELVSRIESDKNNDLTAQPESEYYAQQTWAAGPIKLMGMFIAVVMGVGACFAAMNTMYAAVSYRTKEIATLQVLGFRRRSILISFLAESMLVALVGGIVGCLLSLPVNKLTTATTNLQTFSEVAFAFRTSPQLLLIGMIFAVMIGLFGGLFPARQAARQSLALALRKG